MIYQKKEMKSYIRKTYLFMFQYLRFYHSSFFTSVWLGSFVGEFAQP
jgi:hypothetical protein